MELLKGGKFATFRITTIRSNKRFPLTSQEVNEKIGAFIAEKLAKGVNLEKPGLNCFVEIVENTAFLYTKKTKGPGGLPVGASANAVALLSGGIDSPVAAYHMLKRGVKIIFAHFHSAPFTSPASAEKTKNLAKVLASFNPSQKAKLYLVPFADIQREIMMKTPAKLRIIFYRRLMFKISEAIAAKENAKGLITGESLGQVASQTLENMGAISDSIALPVLRPLVGFDKKEIIKKAKEIGTYEISILPHEDCCSLFIPKHPETRAKLTEIKKAEEGFDAQLLAEKAVKNAKIEIILF
jgi:thiamine biosynthesis protein ThiI